MNRFVLPIAIVCGMCIAWVDSRPGWDDTGITAGLLVLASGAIAFLAPRRVWLIALAVGVWIPFHAIVNAQNYSTVITLLFAFAGAYTGLGIRKLKDGG